jgi:hypothetical protein
VGRRSSEEFVKLGVDPETAAGLFLEVVLAHALPLPRQRRRASSMKARYTGASRCLGTTANIDTRFPIFLSTTFRRNKFDSYLCSNAMSWRPTSFNYRERTLHRLQASNLAQAHALLPHNFGFRVIRNLNALHCH